MGDFQSVAWRQSRFIASLNVYTHRCTSVCSSFLGIPASCFMDVLDSKNGAIKDLQYELARVCKAHNDLLRTYESKLSSFGIPPDELGFKPLETTIAGQQLGKGPAGLVSAPS